MVTCFDACEILEMLSEASVDGQRLDVNFHTVGIEQPEILYA